MLLKILFLITSFTSPPPQELQPTELVQVQGGRACLVCSYCIMYPDGSIYCEGCQIVLCEEPPYHL